MALPASPAPRDSARASSMFSDRLPFRRLVTVLVLARMALLVLSGRVSANVTCSTDVDTDTVDQHRGPGMRGSRTVLRREESGAVMQTAGDTLVVAGLIGLLGLGGAATFLVDSIARPARLAVRVHQAPAEGAEQRVRLATLDELLEAAADAGSPTDVVPPAEQERSVVPEIARVVREAAQEAARAAEAAAAAGEPAARSVLTTRYAAARGRAHGPTTALWHAVELDRLLGAVGDACETTVCGTLVRVSTGQQWPVAERSVCPACATLAR